jgi:hypothetical protein
MINLSSSKGKKIISRIIVAFLVVAMVIGMLVYAGM